VRKGKSVYFIRQGGTESQHNSRTFHDCLHDGAAKFRPPRARFRIPLYLRHGLSCSFQVRFPCDQVEEFAGTKGEEALCLPRATFSRREREEQVRNRKRVVVDNIAMAWKGMRKRIDDILGKEPEGTVTVPQRV